MHPVEHFLNVKHVVLKICQWTGCQWIGRQADTEQTDRQTDTSITIQYQLFHQFPWHVIVHDWIIASLTTLSGYADSLMDWQGITSHSTQHIGDGPNSKWLVLNKQNTTKTSKSNYKKTPKLNRKTYTKH